MPESLGTGKTATYKYKGIYGTGDKSLTINLPESLGTGKTVAYQYNSAQGSGAGKKYYTWADDGSGNRILTDTTTSGSGDITASYDNTGTEQSRMTNPASVPANSLFSGQNYTASTTDMRGGAITWSGVYSGGNLTANFVGNYVQNGYTGSINYFYRGTMGGALSNYICNATGTAEVGNITGDFVGSYIDSKPYYNFGGAISNFAYNDSSYTPVVKLGDITGDFIGNYISGTRCDF